MTGEMPSLDSMPECSAVGPRGLFGGDEPPSLSDHVAMLQIELAAIARFVAEARGAASLSRNPAERRAKAHLSDALGRVHQVVACLEEAQEMIERGTP